MPRIQILQPPNTVTTIVNPSTKELAARSANPMPITPRRSLDGRKFVTEINGINQDQNNARKALCDLYPAGIDASIDAERALGGGIGVPRDNPF